MDQSDLLLVSNRLRDAVALTSLFELGLHALFSLAPHLLVLLRVRLYASLALLRQRLSISLEL